MEAKQLERYRFKLLKLQSDLIKEEKDCEDAVKPVELDQSKVGRVSRIDAIQTQAISIETQRRRIESLEQIKSALIRIDNNDFGYCLDCGDELNKKRLEINPAGTLCVSCAEKREH